MSLQSELTAALAASNIPENIQAKMRDAIESLAGSGIVEAAPKVGDKLPEFELGNQNGEKIKLSSLLADGPLVVTFYRGGWCPYCNLELRAYQNVLPEIHAAGADLVAITPELPDSSLTTAEKNELDFEVLSDVGSKYAHELGVVFTLPDELHDIYVDFGIDPQKYNGTEVLELPLAATYVVSQSGVIVYAFVDADYTRRGEPTDVLQVLQSPELAA